MVGLDIQACLSPVLVTKEINTAGVIGAIRAFLTTRIRMGLTEGASSEDEAEQSKAAKELYFDILGKEGRKEGRKVGRL